MRRVVVFFCLALVRRFARNTHTYLDLDAGANFDRQIVVRNLRRPRAGNLVAGHPGRPDSLEP